MLLAEEDKNSTAQCQPTEAGTQTAVLSAGNYIGFRLAHAMTKLTLPRIPPTRHRGARHRGVCGWLFVSLARILYNY